MYIYFVEQCTVFTRTFYQHSIQQETIKTHAIQDGRVKGSHSQKEA